jgi:GNAT superfamily N-acetyltransferase
VATERDRLRIDPMTRADLDVALEWAAREGWNPGLSDAEAFWAADPEGFLVGRVNGRMVAVISVVQYGDAFAFLGLYIVDSAWRGRGLGWALWSAAMARVTDTTDATVGLDGVVEQQENYARSGFVLAHRSIRFGGVPHGAGHDGVDVLGPADLPAVAVLDIACFGASRRAFLGQWLAIPGGLAAGVREGERLVGYGVIRPCLDGMKVGPLFADDPAVASAILARLAEHAGSGTTVYLDVPEPNSAGVALARSQGLEPVFETARMYRGPALDLPLERVFGITTFELG